MPKVPPPPSQVPQKLCKSAAVCFALSPATHALSSGLQEEGSGVGAPEAHVLRARRLVLRVGRRFDLHSRLEVGLGEAPNLKTQIALVVDRWRCGSFCAEHTIIENRSGSIICSMYISSIQQCAIYRRRVCMYILRSMSSERRRGSGGIGGFARTVESKTSLSCAGTAAGGLFGSINPPQCVDCRSSSLQKCTEHACILAGFWRDFVATYTTMYGIHILPHRSFCRTAS